MKKLLNTLYVTTQGAYLAKDGECVAVRVDNNVKLRVPVHTLGGIVCFGQISCSPFLMGFAAERGLGFSFLTENGRFLARVQGFARNLGPGQFRQNRRRGRDIRPVDTSYGMGMGLTFVRRGIAQFVQQPPEPEAEPVPTIDPPAEQRPARAQ